MAAMVAKYFAQNCGAANATQNEGGLGGILGSPLFGGQAGAVVGRGGILG
ncbi:hypothetical protein [Sphingomonas sp. BAUL-RG-20F-R05-02]|nr:hypothetical protein [Sphingomonas sp. BAUL-RG-20F-R05-02]